MSRRIWRRLALRGRLSLDITPWQAFQTNRKGRRTTIINKWCLACGLPVRTFSWSAFPYLFVDISAAGGIKRRGTFVLDTDKDYQQGDGLVQVVSGVGGRSLRPGSYSQFDYVAAGFSTDTNPAVEDGVTLIDVTPGQLTVSYVAADDGAIIDEFTITAGSNTPPLATDDSYSVDEDATLNVAAPGVLANDSDADSDPLTAVLQAGPSNGNLSLNADGSFSYTPDPDFNGADTFTYRANDGLANSNLATVTLTINPINDLPTAFDDGFSTVVNTPLTVSAPGVLSNDVDVDGDPLTAALVDDVNNGILTLNADGSFDYTPNLDFLGDDSFTYTASDGVADSNVATVTITVTPVGELDYAEAETPRQGTVYRELCGHACQ